LPEGVVPTLGSGVAAGVVGVSPGLEVAVAVAGTVDCTAALAEAEDFGAAVAGDVGATRAQPARRLAAANKAARRRIDGARCRWWSNAMVPIASPRSVAARLPRFIFGQPERHRGTCGDAIP
jgi:hypothetical protein